MAQITISLTEMISFIKNNYRKQIPDNISSIKVVNEKITIIDKSKNSFEISIMLNSFNNGSAYFNISSNKLFDLLTLGSSNISIDIDGFLKKNLIPVKINNIKYYNGYFTIDIGL